MKRIIRFVYFTYHLLFPSRFGVCRFTPTCSEYFLRAVEEKGMIRGSFLGIKRILSCHPLSKRPLYDPI